MSKERIDKIFSNLGILSRNDCKKEIKNKKILLNGNIVKSPDEKADLDLDEITYNGELLDTCKFVYYILNKPSGYVTANKDNLNETIFSLINDTRTDLRAVGRLDIDTTGLLLITNDGELNHKLLSPKYHVDKVYDVICDGELSEIDIKNLENGIDIGDSKPTLPANVKTLSKNHVYLTIHEGRYHQVKRMFEKIGKPVLKLERISFGPLHLDDLKLGEYRKLTNEELELLINCTK